MDVHAKGDQQIHAREAQVRKNLPPTDHQSPLFLGKEKIAHEFKDNQQLSINPSVGGTRRNDMHLIVD
jgi:hypothetical protein